MRITVMGVLIVIGGIALLVIVLDHLGNHLDKSKKVQKEKLEQEKANRNEQLNNPDN